MPLSLSTPFTLRPLLSPGTYLHRSNIIGWYVAQSSPSVHNLPPVLLLDVTLQQNEILALPEAEGLGERGLEVVQGPNHLVAVRSCKCAKFEEESARKREKEIYLDDLGTRIPRLGDANTRRRTHLTSPRCYRPSSKTWVKCDSPDGDNAQVKTGTPQDRLLTFVRAWASHFPPTCLLLPSMAFRRSRPLRVCARACVYTTLPLRHTWSALITARSASNTTVRLHPFTRIRSLRTSCKFARNYRSR